MTIGVSTSNLYPMKTEDALDMLLEAGFRTIEVFINTESEATIGFARKLKKRADRYGANIVSLHSHNSVSESYLYFTDYPRRYEDGLKKLELVFKSAKEMGAPYVIIHGDKPTGPLPDTQSVLRYGELFELGRKNGVTLLQENVANYRSADLAYLREMKSRLKDKAQFVFDIKQSRRCGLEPLQVISVMGEGIRHVHISDNDDCRDCILPGRGKTDFTRIFESLAAYGFNGDIIIELYRKGFKDVSELIKACGYLMDLIKM